MYIRKRYKQAQAELGKLLDEVIEDSDKTVIITRRPGERAALISIHQLRGLMETIHILKNPKAAERLFEAMERADRGEGVTISLEELARLRSEVARAVEAGD